MPRDTILFDINETVLDLSTLKPKFKEYFGDSTITSTWFAALLHSSTICILTDVKSGFAELAGTMLDIQAAKIGVTLEEGQKADILGTFASLPPHADIKPALELLRQSGYRTVAFSNSSSKLIQTQIANSGLADLFSEVISVEETGSFKPDGTVYRFAAQKLNCPIEDLRLVATHDWDTHGAISAGMQAAYIDRTGAPYHPLYKRPDIFADNMVGLVQQVISRDQA